MTIKNQYSCDHLEDSVRPITESDTESGLVTVKGVDCEYLEGIFCIRYSEDCRPLITLRRHADRYNRQVKALTKSKNRAETSADELLLNIITSRSQPSGARNIAAAAFLAAADKDNQEIYQESLLAQSGAK